MKVIYDNDMQVYIVTLEDINCPILIDTDDIVEARDCLVEFITSKFNEAIQEQLTDEQYDDWCFDCDHCKGKTCTHDYPCENGKMWTPKDFEDDLN